MPLPKPRQGEKQSDFVSRCISAETEASPGRDRKQVQAMCYTAWRNRGKENVGPSPNLPFTESAPDGPVVLREAVTLDGVELIEEEGKPRMIRNLRMLGSASRHGYSYTHSAMEKAVKDGLYENTKMFVDHSPKDRARSIMDLAGTFRNTRFEDGSIRGDAVLLSDQWGDKVWQIAKEMPHAAGFSHVANGKMTRQGGKSFVEAITEVLSVDLVTTPATTNNMFESTNGKEMTMDYKEVNVQELRTARPDIVEALTTEGAKTRDEEVNTLMQEKADLEKKLDEYQVKEAVAVRAQEVDELLEASKLPKTARTKVFRDSLLRLDGEDWKKEAQAIIEDRQKMLGGVKNMGDTTTKEGDDDKDVSDKAFRESLNS